MATVGLVSYAMFYQNRSFKNHKHKHVYYTLLPAGWLGARRLNMVNVDKTLVSTIAMELSLSTHIVRESMV